MKRYVASPRSVAALLGLVANNAAARARGEDPPVLDIGFAKSQPPQPARHQGEREMARRRKQIGNGAAGKQK